MIMWIFFYIAVPDALDGHFWCWGFILRVKRPSEASREALGAPIANISILLYNMSVTCPEKFWKNPENSDKKHGKSWKILVSDQAPFRSSPIKGTLIT